jgi:hypothetical protein
MGASFIGRVVLGCFFFLEQVLRNISIMKCRQGKQLFLDKMTQRGHMHDESGDRRLAPLLPKRKGG